MHTQRGNRDVSGLGFRADALRFGVRAFSRKYVERPSGYVGMVKEMWVVLYPRRQILPTLRPKVCKYYLHWAIWIPRVWVSL